MFSLTFKKIMVLNKKFINFLLLVSVVFFNSGEIIGCQIIPEEKLKSAEYYSSKLTATFRKLEELNQNKSEVKSKIQEEKQNLLKLAEENIPSKALIESKKKVMLAQNQVNKTSKKRIDFLGKIILKQHKYDFSSKEQKIITLMKEAGVEIEKLKNLQNEYNNLLEQKLEYNEKYKIIFKKLKALKIRKKLITKTIRKNKHKITKAEIGLIKRKQKQLAKNYCGCMEYYGSLNISVVRLQEMVQELVE